jgi:hypothetical protein
MKTAMWALLGALGVLTAVVSFLLVAPAEGGRFNSEAISAAFTAMAVVVALFVAIQSASRADDERDAAQSLFYLESAEESWSEASRLLASEVADRVSWIAAARLIGNAEAFARRVSEDAHQRRLEAIRLRYRQEFFFALKDKGAGFFYGAKDWAAISVEQAAVQSGAPRARAGRTHFPDDSIPETTLRMIWAAAQFPQGYEDPIEGIFDDSELVRLYGDLAGLEEYILHRRRYLVACGALVERSPSVPADG